MKKYPKLIYADPELTEKTKSEIAAAAIAAQELLDCWNELNLPPLEKLFELIHNPIGVYKRVSEGDIPLNLTSLARKAKNHTVIGNPDLISIKDNKIVVNETEKERILNINYVFAENKVQEVFARNCIEFARLSNLLSEQIMYLPTNRQLAEPFKQVGAPFKILKKVELQVEYVQELIKNM